MRLILATLGLPALLWSHAHGQSQPAQLVNSAITNNQTFHKVHFPDLVRDSLTINFLSPQAGQAYIQAFSLTGQPVLERELGVLPGTNLETVDVSGLPSGTYVLKAIIGEEQLMERFIVAGY